MYPRYSMIGGTAQTVIEVLGDSVWRLEWFYNMNEPYNRGTMAEAVRYMIGLNVIASAWV